MDTPTRQETNSRRVDALGPIGDIVRANLARYRNMRGLSMRALSHLTQERHDLLKEKGYSDSEAGRPVPHVGISNIENGTRQVTVDVLATLCAALDVPIAAIFMPPTSGPDERVNVPGSEPLEAWHYWAWVTGERSINATNATGLEWEPDDPVQTAAMPVWAVATSAGAPMQNWSSLARRDELQQIKAGLHGELLAELRAEFEPRLARLESADERHEDTTGPGEDTTPVRSSTERERHGG